MTTENCDRQLKNWIKKKKIMCPKFWKYPLEIRTKDENFFLKKKKKHELKNTYKRVSEINYNLEKKNKSLMKNCPLN